MLNLSNEYGEGDREDESFGDTSFDDQQGEGGDSGSFKGDSLFTRKDTKSGEKQEDVIRDFSDIELSELKKFLEEYDKLQKRELGRLLELLRIIIILEYYISQQEEMRARKEEKENIGEFTGMPLQDFQKELQGPQAEQMTEAELRGLIEGVIQASTRMPHSRETDNRVEPLYQQIKNDLIKEEKGLGQKAITTEQRKDTKVTSPEHSIKEDAEKNITDEDLNNPQNLQSAFIALEAFKKKKEEEKENVLGEVAEDAIEWMFDEDEGVSALALLFGDPDTELDEVSVECITPEKEQEEVLPFPNRKPG
jgi:hypothetical protein